MAYTYVPATTGPAKDDPFFISWKKGGYASAMVIDKTTGYVLPNCVGWANGRMIYLRDKYLNKKDAVDWHIPCCNAEDWFEQAKKNGLKTGSEPKLGAAIVWKSGTLHNTSDGAGHVAIVEEIKANGDIVCSNSGRGAAIDFWMSTHTKASGYKLNDKSEFLGFIYCGVAFQAPKSSSVTEPVVVKPSTPAPAPAVVPAPAKPVEVKIKAGDAFVMNNTKVYTNPSTLAYKIRGSGTFYAWEDEDATRYDRLRMTNRLDRVGVKGQVSFFVDKAVLRGLRK